MIEVIPYTPAWKNQWDAFVLGSNNGTMFHLQKFFDYHPEGRFPFHHLMFMERNKIIAVLPGGIRNGVFDSPMGASYGSIVTPDIKFSGHIALVDALLDWGKLNGVREFFLTAAPMIYEQYQNQSLEFALLWRGFHYDVHYISSAIKLDPQRDLLERFQRTVKRNVKNSFNDLDISIELNEDYEGFYPILLENKAKHDAKPTHSLQDLYKLKELMPERLKLFMMYYKGLPIAGSLMFVANPQVFLCFYIMMKYEYKHLHPVNRLMYEIGLWATRAGYQYIDIGVSQDTKAENPMTPSYSLIEYKENFDAKTIMRNTLHIKL